MQIYPREIGYRCKPHIYRESSRMITPKAHAPIPARKGKPKAVGASAGLYNPPCPQSASSSGILAGLCGFHALFAIKRFVC